MHYGIGHFDSSVRSGAGVVAHDWAHVLRRKTRENDNLLCVAGHCLDCDWSINLRRSND